MLRERSVSNTVRSTVVSNAKELSKLTTWRGRIFGQHSKKEPTCQGCLLWHTFVRTRTRLPSCEGAKCSRFVIFPCTLHAWIWDTAPNMALGAQKDKSQEHVLFFPFLLLRILRTPMTNRPHLPSLQSSNLEVYPRCVTERHQK